MLLAAGLAAQDPEAGLPVGDPTPLAAEEQERASRAMIRLLGARMEAQAAEQRLREAEQAFRRTLDELRQRHNAQGCALTVDKQWECPPPDPERIEIPSDQEAAGE